MQKNNLNIHIHSFMTFFYDPIVKINNERVEHLIIDEFDNYIIQTPYYRIHIPLQYSPLFLCCRTIIDTSTNSLLQVPNQIYNYVYQKYNSVQNETYEHKVYKKQFNPQIVEFAKKIIEKKYEFKQVDTTFSRHTISLYNDEHEKTHKVPVFVKHYKYNYFGLVNKLYTLQENFPNQRFVEYKTKYFNVKINIVSSKVLNSDHNLFEVNDPILSTSSYSYLESFITMIHYIIKHEFFAKLVLSNKNPFLKKYIDTHNTLFKIINHNDSTFSVSI